jgi:hypothetical protein
MTDKVFKDFDDAASEMEDRTVEFVIGGDTFEVNLNVPAGRVLRWMRNSQKTEAVPELLEMFLGEDDFDRLTKNPNISWNQMSALLTWFAEEMAGGLGNG